jgi:ComEC/Rec2-related protein
LLSIAGGIVLQALTGIPLVYHAPVLAAAVAASFLERRFLLFAVLSLSAMNYELRQPVEMKQGERHLIFSGVVLGETHYPSCTRLSLVVDRIMAGQDTISCDFRADYYTFKKDVLLGKRLVIKGRILPSRHGYRASLLKGEIIDSVVSGHVLSVLFRPIKTYIDEMLSQSFLHDRYRVASGLILGGSGRLAADLRDVFSRAGVLHILAVSGLHVGFVAMIIGFILFFVPVDHRFKYALVMIGLVLYAGVTGFRPSVLRATLMAFLFGLAGILQRNVDHMHILNLTAIAFLIVEPLLIFDVSAQLSFAAVYGILYLFPILNTFVVRRVGVRFLRFLLTSMVVSFSAQLFVAPLLMFYFHRLPVYAVLTNVLIVPLAALIIMLLFMYFFSTLLWSSLAGVVAWVTSILISLLITLSKFFAGLPCSSIAVCISPVFVVPLYLLVLRRARRWVYWWLAVLAAVFSFARSPDCLVVCVTDKSILITVPSGEKVLVSAQKKSALDRLLVEQNVGDLDYLIAPEMHSGVRKKYIALPDRMRFIRILLDETEIDVTSSVTIRYNNMEINYDFSTLDKIDESQGTKYLLTDGVEIHAVGVPSGISILEQMVLDVRLALIRLGFLF